VTRRTIQDNKSTEKNPLDNASTKAVEYPVGVSVTRQGSPALSDNNRTEGIHINDDVWEEFTAVGTYLCRIYPDPDLYDLFNWIRTELYKGQAYSTNFISSIDREIEKELGPWS
jgi:hypothetical protein